MKRIDIIIPYILGPNSGLELKYALRSIAKNFEHDNYRVIIVGDKPDWLTGIEYLQFNRLVEQQNRAFSDQLLKLYSVLTELDISSQFIWTYDDVYFTRPVKLADIKKLKAVASFDRYPQHLDTQAGGSNWKSTLVYTMETVRENGGSNFNYETHLPRLFTKNRVLSLMDKYNLLGRPMMLSSLYYNLYHKNQEPLCLYDRNPFIRFLLRATFDMNTLYKEIKRYQFTNNNPATWNAVLQNALLHLFPANSKFEK